MYFTSKQHQQVAAVTVKKVKCIGLYFQNKSFFQCCHNILVLQLAGTMLNQLRNVPEQLSVFACDVVSVCRHVRGRSTTTWSCSSCLATSACSPACTRWPQCSWCSTMPRRSIPTPLRCARCSNGHSPTLPQT